MDETERDALHVRLRALERQLAQAARREIDIEKESQDALAEAEEFRHAALQREEQHEAEIAQVKRDKESLSKDLEAAQTAASNLHSSSGVHDQALQQKQAEVQAVRETNRLLDGKIQQLQSQLQENATSSKQARELVMELTKERGELDMKRMHTENELRQSQHAKQSLGMEKGILQKDVASLQTQLADKSESLRQSWTDANTKAHELEQQLRDASSQHQALSASNKQLEQQRDRLSEQLQRAQKECQDLQTQLKDQKAAFEEESASLHTLVSRHKEERVSLEKDKHALNGLVQELTRKAEAYKAESQQASAHLQQRLDAAEQACQDRDQTIERFKQAMGENGDVAFLQGPSYTGNGTSAAASPGPSQLSPVQSYSKYVSLVHEHNKLKQEHAKLQSEWEQFESAVIPEAQRAQQLAKRNVDLDEANAKLSAQVQVSNEKAKRCVDNAVKWQGQFDDEKSAHGVTRKLLKEAQHQVVLLANENRQLNGVRERAVMPAWSSATLDANLVELRNTQDLVAKNEVLRRLVHELQLKNDHQLKQTQSEAHEHEQQMMNRYEGSLAAARQQNADAMTQMQHLMRQRDSAQQAARNAAEIHSAASDAQQNGSGHSEHQQHIGELEKELGRLRQDGQAYREDLLHQLEAAKQAATQARYEAGQSNARASYEASQVQQLQDDKTRTADIEDNWKQQAREQQELISNLNKRLDQLHSQASRAKDEAGQLRQRVAVLEAQNELLHKDNQRLLHDSTEHASARWRLAAGRDTELRLNSQQHEADAKERGRLHSELSSLQRELADSQRQLSEERSSHQHSFSVQEAADNRLAEVKEARDKLQEALSKAEKQLTLSESKVTSLQTAVEKGEERAASLELQLKARASPASESSGGKEAELSKTIADLRKDLQEAQDKAAQEAGHVAQFQSLAEAAEESTKAVQGQVESLQAQAAQSAGELRQAKVKLEAAEKDLNAARQSAYEDAQAAIKDKQQAHTSVTNLQAELVIARRHATAEAEKQQKLVTDLETRTNELRQAQLSYNKSVLEHAETVKKLSQQEAAVTELQQGQAAIETAADLAHKGKAAADLAWQQERSKLQTAVQAAQQRLQDLEKVNAQLQVHLDTHARAAAGQAPDEGGQLAGLVQYLQKRLRTLEAENTSLEQLASRQRADLEAATNRATQADQARLETAEKLKASLRNQEEQARLMEQVQESNVLRESNVTLRGVSEKNRKEADIWKRRAQEVEAQVEPLKRELNELLAAKESHAQELQIHQQQHQNSERRIEGLLHKADAVDKAEYERVVAAHAAAQDNSTRLLAVNTHLQADINRLQPLADQIAPLQATVQSLESEVADQRTTIKEQRSQSSLGAQIYKNFNPESLKIPDWKVWMTRNMQRLEKLEMSDIDQKQGLADRDVSIESMRKNESAAQAEISRLRQDAATAGATTQDQQKQQQAELANIQTLEQSLRLQTTALTLEMKQKDSRLEEVTKCKQQVEAELSKVNAELATSKAQLERATVELKDKPAQQPAASPVPEAEIGTSQQVAAPTSSEQQQQLITREAALQEAQAALQTQQQQLADNQKELQQQQQSLATTQQQFVEQQQRLTASEQQLQQQQAACREKAQELAEHKAQLQAQEGASVQAGQQQQEVSDAKVLQLQEQVTDLEKKGRIRLASANKHQKSAEVMKKKLDARINTLNTASCKARALQEVVNALEQHVKGMADQMTQAGLQVPEEVDVKGISDNAYSKCMAEKEKGPAGSAKVAQKAPPKGSPQGAIASKPVQNNATTAEAPAALPEADTTGAGSAPSAADEIAAVRSAALASVSKQAPAGGGTMSSSGPASPRQSGVTPILRLRPTLVQQGGKRERDTSPSAPSAAEATAGSDLPPAKRVRAPTPAGDAPPSTGDQPIIPLAANAVPMQVQQHQQQPQESLAQSAATQQLNASAPPVTGQAAAAQEHVATVVVTEQDPEHVQVKIERPAALVPSEVASQQHTGSEPAATPAEHIQQQADTDAGDVDMTEAAGDTAQQPAQSVPVQEDAEDGELPDDNAVTGSQAQLIAQDPQSSAAQATGQTDGSDAEATGAVGRKPRPIIFALPEPTLPEVPAVPAPVTEVHQRGGRTPAAGVRPGAHGRRGGTAAGRSLHSAARGAPKGRGNSRGRH